MTAIQKVVVRLYRFFFPKEERPYRRSDDMQALHELTVTTEKRKAELFNQREQDRWNAMLRTEEVYKQQQKELEDMCRSKGMSDAETANFILISGYGPRVRCIRPPAIIIVEE